MNVNQTLRDITLWSNGNDHRRHAIAEYGKTKLGIKDFDGVHQLHADKDGSFVPEPEDGWPSRKKDMEQALNEGRLKCYNQIWQAIQDGTISTDSSAQTPPSESVNDPVIDATELMDDTDTPPDEDDKLEQRLEEGAEEVATAVDREPVVTERIADETPNFLEMDEDLEVAIEDDDEVRRDRHILYRKVGEREMLRGLHLIIREVVKEELKDIKAAPTNKTELKELIKQTLKEAF